MIDPKKLNKMKTARYLLDPPAPEVVGELINEIERLRSALLKVKSWIDQHGAWCPVCETIVNLEAKHSGDCILEEIGDEDE